jgi:hypothetical protein
MVETNLSTTEEDVDTVILRIPYSVKQDETNLRSWLNIRFESVIKALMKKTTK